MVKWLRNKQNQILLVSMSKMTSLLDLYKNKHDMRTSYSSQTFCKIIFNMLLLLYNNKWWGIHAGIANIFWSLSLSLWHYIHIYNLLEKIICKLLLKKLYFSLFILPYRDKNVGSTKWHICDEYYCFLIQWFFFFPIFHCNSLNPQLYF